MARSKASTATPRPTLGRSCKDKPAAVEEEQASEDEVIASLAPPPSKKPRTSKPTKVKPSKFKLDLLSRLPSDLIVLLVAHIHPPDLLCLTRVSKGIRALLLNRSSEPIWQACARAVHPPLPSTPADISLPAYFSLCFERFCFSCDRGWHDTIFFGLRTRLCHDCKCTKIVRQDEVDDVFGEGFDPVILELVHRQVDHKGKNLYNLEEVVEMERIVSEEGLSPAEIKSRKKLMQRASKTNDDYGHWKQRQRAYSTAEDEAYELETLERADVLEQAITARYIAEGLDADELMNVDWHSMANSAPLRTADLDDQNWPDIRSRLQERFLTRRMLAQIEASEEQIDQAAGRRIERLLHACEYVEQWTESVQRKDRKPALMPLVDDLIKLGDWPALINNDVHRRDYIPGNLASDALDKLDDHVDRFLLDAQMLLVTSPLHYMPGDITKAFERTIFLRQPTTLWRCRFVCQGLHHCRKILAWPGILRHRHEHSVHCGHHDVAFGGALTTKKASYYPDHVAGALLLVLLAKLPTCDRNKTAGCSFEELENLGPYIEDGDIQQPRSLADILAHTTRYNFNGRTIRMQTDDDVGQAAHDVEVAKQEHAVYRCGIGRGCQFGKLYSKEDGIAHITKRHGKLKRGVEPFDKLQLDDDALKKAANAILKARESEVPVRE